MIWINAKPAAAAVREFFGSSQLSQFMDQTNPLSEITHKRRLVRARAKRPDTRARRASKCATCIRPITAASAPFDRDAGRTEYRPDQQPCHICARVISISSATINSPYRRVVNGKVTDEVVYLSAMEESRYAIAQANVELDAQGMV